MDIPPNQYQFCTNATTVLWSATMSSTFFIVSMTFECFYSIIRPHKAATLNITKRARIMILSIVIISILFSIPYLFTLTNVGRNCIPDQSETWKTLYYWINYVVQFAVAFVSLLSMNSVIIHTLRKRSMLIIMPEVTSNQIKIKSPK